MPAAPKPVAFHTARIGGAVLTGFAFAGMVAIFVAMTVDAMHLDRVGIIHARWLFMVVLSSVPLFAAHGASTSFLDAYAQGKFYLPPSAAAQTGGGSTANPWHNALLAGCVVGLPITILSYALIPRLWPQHGFSPSGFAALIAACSGVLAAAVMFAWTGRAFLREVAVPAQGRPFQGTLKSYIWQRHVVPQFLVNAWFNAWAALSLVHGPVSDPNSSMPRNGLLIDAFVSPLGLALGIAAGTRAYASFDLRWGVVAAQPARARGSVRPAWLMLGGALVTGIAIALVVFALGIEQVHTWPLTAARGLLCGAYCGAVAYWNVHWTLSAAAPSPATSMTASQPIAAAPAVAITTDPAR